MRDYVIAVLVVCLSCDIKGGGDSAPLNADTSVVQESHTKLNGQICDVEPATERALVLRNITIDNEYPVGDLFLLDIETGNSELLSDSVPAVSHSASFVGSNSVGIIKDGVLIYDIEKGKYETLTPQLSEDQNIIGFASSNGKTALIIKDHATQMILSRFFQNSTQIKPDEPLLPFQYSETDARLIVPSFWNKNNLIVAIDGRLAIYNDEQSTVTIITEKLAYYNSDDLIAVTPDLMIYYTFGDDQKLVLNEYDFRTASSKIIRNVNIELDYNRSRSITLNVGNIDNEPVILLYTDSQSYKYVPGEWIQLDRNYVYRRSGVSLIRSDHGDEFYLTRE